MATNFSDIGIDVPRGFRGEWRSTCPVCSHTRRKKYDECLSANTDCGIWHCHNCGYSGRLDGYAPSKSQKPWPPTREGKIRRIWESAVPLPFYGPATLYLRRRGFYCRFDGHYPSALRYHQRLRYHYDKKTFTEHPAIVAAFQDIDGDITGLLRIYLTVFGTKARVGNPKRMMASFPGALVGSAIQLYPPANGDLAIAEGLETALGVRMLSGLPVWAAGSARQLENVALPRSVHTVHICPDHDDAGLRAANALAKRMLAQGREVRMAVPDDLGSDWSDISRKEVVGDKAV